MASDHVWEGEMRCPLGELVSLRAYPGGVVSVCIGDTSTGEPQGIAAVLPPVWSDEFARLWNLARRAADHRQPLTVAAVDPAAMDALGQLADAAQEMRGDG